MAIKWRELASEDLVNIVTHIAVKDPVAALRVDTEIHRQLSILATSPGIGRPSRVAGYKEFVFTKLPYVAPYRIDGRNDVEIMRLYHDAQNWKKI